MDRDLRNRVAELEPWQQVAMVAGSVERMAPVFLMAASPEEQRDYRAVADTLWALAREGAEFTLTEAQEPFARLWPYPDDHSTEEEEEEEDEEASYAQHNPVYWKIHVLHGIYLTLWYARRDGFPKGARIGAGHALDTVDSVSQYVRGRLPEGIVPDHPDSSEPFIDNEKDNLRTCLRLLHETPDRVEAVAALRALSEQQAAFLTEALLPHWVQERGWTPEDLRAANGVQRVRAI